MDDLIGKVVAGRYRVLGELGRGGMGVVYRVEHTRTGEQLALKVLLGAARFDSQSLARFRREARASAKVDSAYVVRVLDADDAPELGGAPFLVMELLRGEDLERRVVEHGPLAPSDLVPILAQVGSAVERAHRVGVVHRDLKPENLFLHEGPDGKRIAKVLDFGISRFVSEAALAASASATATGSLVGTPLFMAPEQAAGEHPKIGPATDIWALGLVTMRLLTGEHYWGSGSIAEIVTKIMVGVMPPPSARWPDSKVMSPALDVWFARSCARDPSARFASVEEQMTTLAQAAGIDATKEWSGTDLPVSSSSRLSDAALAPTEHDTARTETPLAAVAPVEPTKGRGRWRVRTLAAAAVFAAVGGGAYATRHQRVPAVATTAAAVSPLTLTATSGTLACPVFVSSGTRDAGWFGAAAAEYACRISTDLLGGRPERVKVPAELLGLPRSPVPDFPVEPFEEAHARDRTLEAAHRADAYLDGHIERRPGSFKVTIEMHRPGGETIGVSTSEDTDFYRVILAAMKKLVAAGPFPMASMVDPEIAYWRQFADVDSALWVRDILTQVGPERCVGWEAYADKIGGFRLEMEALCNGAKGRFDASSFPAMVLTIDATPDQEVNRTLDALRAERGKSASSYARMLLSFGEATLLNDRLGDGSQAAGVLWGAMAEPAAADTLWIAAIRYAVTATSTVDTRVLAAGRAWVPSSYFAWAGVWRGAGGRNVRRAFELQPKAFAGASRAAAELSRSGERSELASLIGDISGWSSFTHARRASAFALAELDILEARFGQARRRYEALLEEQDLDDYELATFLDAWNLVRVALGGTSSTGEKQITDDLLRRMEPRLGMQQMNGLVEPFVTLALLGSPRSSIAALERIRPRVTVSRTLALLDGAVPKLHGDERGAVDRWRPLILSAPDRIPSDAFAAVGDYETALRLTTTDAEARNFAGLPRTAPQTARYLYMSGEKARARDLAKQVLEKWSASDSDVPILEDMRKIIANRPLQ